jgi:hypothetical protein
MGNLDSTSHPQKIRDSKVTLFAIITGGALLGLAWLTREERQWLIIVCTALLFVALVGQRKRNAKSLIVLCLLFLVPLTLIIQVNKSVNYHNYGVALANDSSTGEFDDFLRNLQSVNADITTHRQFVPIRNSQLEGAYKVSPLVAELEPFLEDDLDRWLAPGCSTYGICDEFSGGWAPWAIRDAIELSGNWETERVAQDYMMKASDEIMNACRSKEISCAKPISSLGNLSNTEMSLALKTIWLDISSLRTAGYGYLNYDEVAADQVVWDVWRNNTHGLNSTTEIFNQRTIRIEENFGSFQRIWSDSYSKALNIAIVFSLLGYAKFIFWRKSRTKGIYLIGLIGAAAFVLVLSRSAMLALVHLNSFPAISLSYSLPSIPLLYVSIGCGILLLINSASNNSPLPSAQSSNG